MTVRKPIAAGQFYPSSKKTLEKDISDFIDKAAKKQRVLGCIAPHAGYMYSGGVAGLVFSKIDIPDTVVILGPNHTGGGAVFALYEQGSWHTPLGEAQIDNKLAKAILNKSRYIEADDTAHINEHSLEVLLPFIQYFKKDCKIVPVVVSTHSIDAYREAGKAIADAITEQGKDVLVVASSDMSHYESQRSAEEKDKRAIEAILNLDEEELIKRVQEYGITMCGYAPTAIMLSCCKRLGATSAELVKYATSGEATGDYDAVVGYAGILII